MRRSPAIFLLLLPLLPVSGQEVDSVKAEKTRQKVIAWMLNDDARILPAARDTGVAGFEIFDPSYLYYRYPVKTGNIVAPVFSASFAEWPVRKDNFFLQYYKPYIFNPSNQIYYRARTPFTQATYTSGGQKVNQEQVLDIIHTQNVNKELNFGLVMNFLTGEGQYAFQKQQKRTFGFFTSYLGKRYAGFAHISTNNIKAQENGGIRDKDFLESNKPRDVPVNLGFESKAMTRVKNMNFQILNYYAFGKFGSEHKDTTAAEETGDEPHLPRGWGRLSYKLRYEKVSHSYTDHNPVSGFYRNIYYDSLRTYDTAWYRLWLNEVALELQSNPERRFSVASRFGLRNEMEKYAENGQTDTLINTHKGDTVITNMHDHYISNTALFGEIFNNIGERFQWKAWGTLYMLGYKAGNTEVHGTLRKTIGKKEKPLSLYLYGDFTLKRPLYRMNHFTSNHFIWENDFRFTKNLTGGVRFRIPTAHAGVQLQVTLLNQYVYFDSLALPAQHDGSLILYNLELNKDFYLGKFSFLNQFCLQQSSNQEVMPLPLFSFRNSTAFNHTFHFKSTGGILQMQLGLDIYYQTSWYGYAYMPATGQFYVQQKTKIGNYPFMDAYLNIKIKRLRFFVKVQHFSSELFGPGYFTVVDYPMNQLFFKMGISWTFYD